MLDFAHLPLPVQRAARAFHEAGEAAWLVGGATRDALLGREVKDWDFVIAGDGLAWARRLANALGGAFVALDAERGVGRVVLDHEGKPLWIDVARFRAGKPDRSQRPVSFDLEADLRLRDFSVNAIAIEPLTGAVVDPTGGVADLRAGLLRATGPRAFANDPLRILRAARLQATHGLTFAPDMALAMRAAVPALAQVAAERVRDEWMKLLAPPGAAARVEQLDELGVIALLLPDLSACKGVSQSPPHSHDVWGHSLLVLDAMEGLWPWAETERQKAKGKGQKAKGTAGQEAAEIEIAPTSSHSSPTIWSGDLARFREPMAAHLRREMAQEVSRWALLKQVALLHDIGKPPTRTVGADGRIHFYSHDREGARMVVAAMQRMKFAAKSVAYAERLVFQHLRPLNLSSHLPPSHRALYRYFRDTRDEGPDIALHSIADQRGKAFATDRPAVMAVVGALFAAFWDAPERYVHPKPLLDGNEVMALTGLTGPRVGELLELLREQQAQGRLRTRADAERLLREAATRGKGGKGGRDR